MSAASWEHDPVRMHLGLAVKAVVQFADELLIGRAIRLGHMQDEFIQIERVIARLAQFELPGADVRGVIEDVFELVEIHERALSCRGCISRISEAREIRPTRRAWCGRNADTVP